MKDEDDPLGKSGVALVAMAVAVATSLPYAWSALATGNGQVYLGMKAVNSADFMTYVAWMVQDEPSPWLRNLYTSDPGAGRILVPFFWLLGVAARASGLSPILVLHLARAASCLVLYPVLFWLCGLFFTGRSRARAFLLLGLGTGLPGFIPEVSPISACYDSALFAISWALLCAGLGLAHVGLDRRRQGQSAGAGAIASVLAVIHPYDAVTILAVAVTAAIAARGSAPRARLVHVAIVALAAAPGVALTAWNVATTPGLAEWASVARPAIWWSPLSFGCLWIGAAYALARCRDRCPRFAVVWLATSLVLIALPSPIARRLLQGVQAPLAILATIGFEALIARGWARFARLTEVTFYPAAVLMLVVEPLLPAPPRLPAKVVADLRALGDLPPGAILADPAVSYFVPPLSGKPVHCGNYGLTPAYDAKKDDWGGFVKGTIGISELRARHIAYVAAPRSIPLDDRGLPRLRELSTLIVYRVP